MEVSELYTPLSEALTELERRQGDAELRKKVDEYFKDSPLPPSFPSVPCTIMAPALVTPNLEMEYLIDIWRHVALPKVFFEFGRDKFVHINSVKHALGDLTFYRQDSYGRKKILDSMRVVDFQKWQGKPMDEVITSTGETLPKFHHRLFRTYFPNIDIEIIEFSDWFRGAKNFKAGLPYFRYLSLFLTQGILLANFTLEKRERAFTESSVLPAFIEIRRVFGISPLVVPIESIGTDDQQLWCYYPEKVKTFI